jgi:protoheme IX farnesyltransferase
MTTTPALTLAGSTPADYLELTKPRITATVMLTTLVGFVAGRVGTVRVPGLLAVLLGTGLVAAGASTLNMFLERGTDALMLRTRMRPLPAGRLRPVEALAFGAALTLVGLGALYALSGAAAALVALTTWSSYLFLYTPLKTRTSLSTIVGAFPGALPPVIGWAAAREELGPGAYVLFAILFLWQIPHFLAIAWIYRDDYARGGLPMLPVLDREGRLTGRQVVANSMALTLVSIAPVAAGLSGSLYLWGSLLLGVGLVVAAVRMAVARDLPSARGLFVASILYLIGLCTLLLVDRR